MTKIEKSQFTFTMYKGICITNSLSKILQILKVSFHNQRDLYQLDGSSCELVHSIYLKIRSLNDLSKNNSLYLNSLNQMN